MRNIILEGFDGGGKTTLAQIISSRFNLFYQPSEGKEKYRGECSERSMRYFAREGYVFDRHPIISNDIYIPVSGALPITEPTMVMWRKLRPYHLIIYCAGGSFEEQVPGQFDTPEYQALLRENESIIKKRYEAWAPTEADVIYRKTNDHNKLFSLIGGFLCSEY